MLVRRLALASTSSVLSGRSLDIFADDHDQNDFHALKDVNFNKRKPEISKRS